MSGLHFDSLDDCPRVDDQKVSLNDALRFMALFESSSTCGRLFLRPVEWNGKNKTRLILHRELLENREFEKRRLDQVEIMAASEKYIFSGNDNVFLGIELLIKGLDIGIIDEFTEVSELEWA